MRDVQLCNFLLHGPREGNCPLENCRYIHNLEEYFQSKGDDLADRCPVYEAKGFCPRGVTCRFAKSHLDANGQNMKRTDYDPNKASSTCNGITPGNLQNLSFFFTNLLT